MAPKIFATGTTGYIGGDALYVLMQAHPDSDVTCLVRSSEKGAAIASKYPKIKLVYGDLDSATILEEEAKKADIVLHFARADHEGAAEALTKGLISRSQDPPGYLIHTSGTGILTVTDGARTIFGEASATVYDDWEGIEQVRSLPDWAPYRNVEKILLAAGTEHRSKIKTAIVCPPIVYGQGRGPGNDRSIQVPELSRCTLEKKKGIQFGAGRNHWTNVHIHDLSDCYLALVEAAIDHGGKATWGQDGYYFAENGEHTWGTISQLIASAAHKQGFLSSDEVVTVTIEEADQLHRYGAFIWATNSRCRAIRARKLLGWSPKGISLEGEIPDTLTREAKELGLVLGHAAQVTS